MSIDMGVTRARSYVELMRLVIDAREEGNDVAAFEYIEALSAALSHEFKQLQDLVPFVYELGGGQKSAGATQ